MTNKEFMKNDLFIECCRKANLEPTKRQASKFRMQKGKAYKKGMAHETAKKNHVGMGGDFRHKDNGFNRI